MSFYSLRIYTVKGGRAWDPCVPLKEWKLHIWKSFRNQACVVISLYRHESQLKKLLKLQCLPYHYLFYQCIFNSQHNALNDLYSVTGLYARPLFKTENENIPTTLSHRLRKVGVQHNFESALYAHDSSNTVWSTCPIFQPSRSNTCSHAGAYLATQSQGICLGRATGKGK